MSDAPIYLLRQEMICMTQWNDMEWSGVEGGEMKLLIHCYNPYKSLSDRRVNPI